MIGPAVLNGGVTTFLALILCGWSTSHTFVIFFKVSEFGTLHLMSSNVKLTTRAKTK